MVDWVKQRWYGTTVLLCVFCLMIGAGLAIIVGRTQPPQWIVFGGNGDPGDNNGGGMFKNELVRLGWASENNIFQVTYRADVAHMEQSTQAAMTPATTAYRRLCGGGCIIAGFSQGSDPAIELSNITGHPGGSVYLFSAPQPSTGVWHHFYPDHPWVEPFLQQSGFPTDRRPKPGTKHFYDQDDPYADLAPQCLNGGAVFSTWVTVAQAHVVQPPGGDVWIGADGVENHEFNAQRNPITVSGRDGQQFGCPDSGWQVQPPPNPDALLHTAPGPLAPR